MDERGLPFALPYVGSEEEEAIGLLSGVVGRLLDDYWQQLATLRAHAFRYSRWLFGAALLTLILFLLQDFEQAPALQLVALALLPLTLSAAALWLRLRLVTVDRHPPPTVTTVRKLSWLWVAAAIDDQRLLLWDTLCDEGAVLAFPPDVPQRAPWLLPTGTVDGIQSASQERQLLQQLIAVQSAWSTPFQSRQMPTVGAEGEVLLPFLQRAPRVSRRWQPAPALAGPRSLDAGLADLAALLERYRAAPTQYQQFARWEEALQVGEARLIDALRQRQPPIDPPPLLPEGQPIGSVESILSAMELLRSRAFMPIAALVGGELEQRLSGYASELASIDRARQHDLAQLGYHNDTVFRSLQRQLRHIEADSLPQAEQSLAQSRLRFEAGQSRLMELEQRRKSHHAEWMALNEARRGGPRPSAEHLAQLAETIKELNAAIPEAQRTLAALRDAVHNNERMVAGLRQQRADQLADIEDYLSTQQLERREIERRYAAQSHAVDERLRPEIEALQQDSLFFEQLFDHFSTTLKQHRRDLAIDQQSDRAFTQTFEGAKRLQATKEGAIQRWAQRVASEIGRWREAVVQIEAAVDGAALPNHGIRQRRYWLPIWFVESHGITPTLWPWQAGDRWEESRFVVPMQPHPTGQRLALPHAARQRFAPVAALHRRLAVLMQGERADSLRHAARTHGKVIEIEAETLQRVAAQSAMPTAMLSALQLIATPRATARLSVARAADDGYVAAPPADDGDAWVAPRHEAPLDDAWQGDDDDSTVTPYEAKP